MAWGAKTPANWRAAWPWRSFRGPWRNTSQPTNPPIKLFCDALAEANQAIIDAGHGQPLGRRMGTTAVCALKQNGQVFVANMGDSRAYLIREGRAEQLTSDHTVAAALVACGALTAGGSPDQPLQQQALQISRLHRNQRCP